MRLGLLLIFWMHSRAFSCPSACSSRGTCNIFNQCECFEGRTGADCSEHVCPFASAWTGPTVGTDSGHQPAECSNAGICNRETGICACFTSFTGHACERLVCPATAGVECSGHGKCLTMENYAKELSHNAYKYGLDGIASLSHQSFSIDDETREALGNGALALRSWYQYNEVWDASKIQGCSCDYPWTGYDCSERECPRGDDPLTSGQFDEIQLVECNTTFHHQYIKVFGDSPITEGTFALKYGAEITRPLPHNASANAIAQSLRTLKSVRGEMSADDDEAVLVSLTEKRQNGVQRVWNLTINEKSDQYPLVPLFKQPEVQIFECAADRGFMTFEFPAPYPSGSTFNGICYGGPKEGTKCARSEDCVSGILTGEGTKCGPKKIEEIRLKHDATALEVQLALQTFSLVDEIRVNFTEGLDSLCTPEGNTIAITFLRTRIDLETKGDLPLLKTNAGNSLRRKSTPVVDGHGKVVLSPVREAVQGVDTCLREEVQTISCKAAAGSFRISQIQAPSHPRYDSAGSSVILGFDASEVETKEALESFSMVENVTVSYSTGHTKFCGVDVINHIVITFHAMADVFHRRSGDGDRGAADGDVPELLFSRVGLSHPQNIILASIATEVVKGLTCVPLGSTYVAPLQIDSRGVEEVLKIHTSQMMAGEVFPYHDGGYFSLSYLGETTTLIAARGGPGDVRDALNELSTVDQVNVTFSSEHACQMPRNVMAVTFLGNFGRLTPLQVDSRRMPQHSKIRIIHGGERDSTGNYVSVVGTKENDVCSNHGRCLPEFGVCDCFTEQDFGYDHAFTSSDGRGGPGTRGDCGYQISPRGDPRSIWHMKQHDSSGGATVLGTYKQATQMVHERSWGKDFPVTDCPGLLGCSGHGHCSGPPTYRCECADGWTHSADCSEQDCPRSSAWFDSPSANNNAHSSAGVECSNRGLCDRESAQCICQDGFTGAACQFTVCPGQEISQRGSTPIYGKEDRGHECSGHGRCIDMKQFARLTSTDRGDVAHFTYGNDPNNPYTWDAVKLRGCFCDEEWQGADCSERVCPYGDDPNTHDDVDEVQIFNCSGTYGSFTLSFQSTVNDGDSTRRSAITAPIPYNASRKEVERILEELPTIEDVIVTFSSESHDRVCVGSDGEANVVSVRFLYEIGDLPPLVVDTSELIFGHDGTRGKVSIATNGETIHGVSSVAGSRERLECCGRGLCNRDSGVCECFPGYASGNGLNRNERGTRGDCGYLIGDKLLLRGTFRGDTEFKAHSSSTNKLLAPIRSAVDNVDILGSTSVIEFPSGETYVSEMKKKVNRQLSETGQRRLLEVRSVHTSGAETTYEQPTRSIFQVLRQKFFFWCNRGR